MDITNLNLEVDKYNEEFGSFQLDKKLMIMKAATLKEECSSTIKEIEKKIEKLEADKTSAKSRMQELDNILSSL